METLAMYKPNFCSECGSRIERSRWHPWTSRKFCADCAPRFGRAQILLPIIAGAALFSAGLVMGRAVRSAPPPVTVDRGELPVVTAPATKSEGKKGDGKKGESKKDEGRDESKVVETVESEKPVPRPDPASEPDAIVPERPAAPKEVVTVCGAETKKGTPCQRRVHGTGRCWQHRGMPAMIPLEQRIITGT
jgi:hypothetical protein